MVDVPYNGDPGLVEVMPTVPEALAMLRAAGLRLGVISNQSGIARGMIGIDQVEAVNRRVDELLGPFDVWLYCPHGPQDGCNCRKPLPKMVVDAARALEVEPSACVVVGDKESDVQAALAAGARALRFIPGSDMKKLLRSLINLEPV